MSVKEQYWRYSLISLILLLGIILFLKVTPFMSGILGALTLYILVRKQMYYLTKKRKMRRSLAAVVLLFEAVLCFLIPLSLAVWLLIDKLQNFNLDLNAFVASAEHVAELIESKTGYNVLEKKNLLSAASVLPRIGQVLMGEISGFAINIFVLLFVLYFMLTGGRKMENYIYEILPFNDENKRHVSREINLIVTSNAIGIPLQAILQGVVALIGYYIFNAPDPLLFGFLTCLATVIPLVGTALVWVPLALYMAVAGQWVSAVGLVIYASIVISNVDNLIRFILQKKMADTHPLITIFGVVIGLSLFGFMGIIFGPLLLSIFLLCIDIFKKEYLDSPQ